MAAFSEALLTLFKNLAGQFSELRTQIVSGPLKVLQALLVRFALLVQLSTNTGMSCAQRTQLIPHSISFGLQVMQAFSAFQTLFLQPLRLAPQGRQLGLQDRKSTRLNS